MRNSNRREATLTPTTERKSKNMIRRLVFVLALLLFAGCQKDTTELTDDKRPNPDGSVGFWLTTEDDRQQGDDVESRGTPQKTLDKYTSVRVDTYSHTSNYWANVGNDVELFREIKLEQEDAKWKYKPAMYWPMGYKLSFLAYASDIDFAKAGITFSPETGAPTTLTYNVPEDVTKQPDLLVATKFDQAQVANISLNMRHALACVSFCGVAPDEKIFVKKITLRNVCSEGTLALNDPDIKWAVNPDSYGLTVFDSGVNKDQELGNGPQVDNNYLMTADGYLMMVPQKLNNAAIDVLYWNGEDDTKDRVVTYILPVDKESYGTWLPGKKYIYKFGSQSETDITVVYYEKYADNSYGLYYYEKAVLHDSLEPENGTREIVEAGYGVLSKKDIGTQLAPIRISTPLSASISTGPFVKLAEDSYLYPVDQSGAAKFTFPLTNSTTPQNIYFNGSDKSCGMIVPHFAKGVYTAKVPAKTHAIRTPQQMRNISALGASPIQFTNAYTQERNLDFARSTIGGGLLTTPIVNCEFKDSFDGKSRTMKNVDINAISTNGALFLLNSGEIKDVVLTNSSIISGGNAGGIAAENTTNGTILRPRVVGESITTPITIKGSSYVGAIVGLNRGQITGNIATDNATELPIAEVSGWGLVEGSNQPVGGIAGENLGTITTCLVNGVYVYGTAQGNVLPAKITIRGGEYVGGIVGVNRTMVVGNYSEQPSGIQAEPDVAGLVAIEGSNFVGGIAGENDGTLNQVNLRLGRGDASKAITITGQLSVGGIVGFNKGTLKAEGNSFISVRGNVIITGTENVGGIVGNHQSGDISNCFVYNFYSQSYPLIHHAPKIRGTNKVGGIAGLAGTTGHITRCAVFSTVSEANVADGNASNAMAEISATGRSGGGIVGHGISGMDISASYVLGNVTINVSENSGGIVGENNVGTSIKTVYIGNSGSEVKDIIYKLFDDVKLPVRDARMQTGTGVMTNTSGTPTILGNTYVGGICGVNWGTVDGVSLKDNVKIGTLASTFVGGIAGGNGVGATIVKCKTYNPSAPGTSEVAITGINQVGGISGVNNGIVDQCQLGMPGEGGSRLITINGASGVGGIVGLNGGNENCIVDGFKGSGDDRTCITNSNVYGQVAIVATNERVGGIIGQNGPTNKITNCSVIGYTSSYTNSTTFNYDVTIKGLHFVGGIAGSNYGDIHGLSATVSNTVTHTAVIANNTYAGGLVGTMKAKRAVDDKNSEFEAKLYYCDVSRGVLIHLNQNATGVFVGQLDGESDKDNPTLFGTAPAGPTNRIYGGDIDRIIIDGNGSYINYPGPIGSQVYPPDPPSQGNLWAWFQLGNYLYWTTYK